MGQRAQAFTLEAVVAGLILLSSVVFALQMTAVTPLSASTSSQHLENQLSASAEGLLAVSTADGSLERALLSYNESTSTFINATYQDYYAGSPPDNEFGQRLDWAFARRGIAYNVYVTYDVGGVGRERRMIYRGRPSDNAVSAETTVVLTDDDPLYNDTDGDGRAEPRPDDDLNSTDYFASDQSATGLYNVVLVEVVVWRI